MWYTRIPELIPGWICAEIHIKLQLGADAHDRLCDTCLTQKKSCLKRKGGSRSSCPTALWLHASRLLLLFVSKSHKVEFSPLCCHESTLTELHGLSERDTKHQHASICPAARATCKTGEARTPPGWATSLPTPARLSVQTGVAWELWRWRGGRRRRKKSFGSVKDKRTAAQTADEGVYKWHHTKWEEQLHIPPEALSSKCTSQQLLQQLLTRCASAAHLPQTRRTSVHHACRRRAFVASSACKRASAAALLLLLRAHLASVATPACQLRICCCPTCMQIWHLLHLMHAHCASLAPPLCILRIYFIPLHLLHANCTFVAAQLHLLWANCASAAPPACKLHICWASLALLLHVRTSLNLKLCSPLISNFFCCASTLVLRNIPDTQQHLKKILSCLIPADAWELRGFQRPLLVTSAAGNPTVSRGPPQSSVKAVFVRPRGISVVVFLRFGSPLGIVCFQDSGQRLRLTGCAPAHQTHVTHASSGSHWRHCPRFHS